MAAPARPSNTNRYATAAAASSVTAAASSSSNSSASSATDELTSHLAQASLSANGAVVREWRTPDEYRWRAAWDSDGNGNLSYFPREVFRSPEGESVSIHGKGMRVSKQVHELLELLMRKQEPLRLHPVELTAPAEPTATDELLSFKSAHGDDSSWPREVNLSDRKEPDDDASACGVLPWIWFKNEWCWLLQESKSKPESAMSGQPKIDPLRGKPIRGVNENVLSFADTGARATWAESCRVLLLSEADVAGAVDLDHDRESLNSSHLFHVQLVAPNEAEMTRWIGDKDQDGSFCHAFAHNQALLRKWADECEQRGASYEKIRRKINKIEQLWLCPVNQLMQSMVAMAVDYTTHHVVRRPPDSAPTHDNQAFVQYLPWSWLGGKGKERLQRMLEKEAGVHATAIKVKEPRNVPACMRPRPFAFVTFPSQADLDKALALNGHPLPGEDHPPAFLDIATSKKKQALEKQKRLSRGHKANSVDDAVRHDRNPRQWGDY